MQNPFRRKLKFSESRKQDGYSGPENPSVSNGAKETIGVELIYFPLITLF